MHCSSSPAAAGSSTYQEQAEADMPLLSILNLNISSSSNWSSLVVCDGVAAVQTLRVSLPCAVELQSMAAVDAERDPGQRIAAVDIAATRREETAVAAVAAAAVVVVQTSGSESNSGIAPAERLKAVRTRRLASIRKSRKAVTKITRNGKAAGQPKLQA